MKKAIALALMLGVLAAPAQAGRAHRYEATIRCRTQLQEDAAGAVKLVKYERTDDGLKLVYRCTRRGY